VTGFEPFDGFSVNPSEEIAKSFNGHRIGRYNVVGMVLPLDYHNALAHLDTALQKDKPCVVLCCGQANRAAISVERLAVNILSTSKPDNYGNTPESDIIDPEGPAAYFANIDPFPLVHALLESGIPAHVSYHAGAYGCNWLLYNVMHRIEKGIIDAKATFIHLPPLPAQAVQKDAIALATMPLDLQQKALEIIISSLG
jgi:pyroglutamyl-peptidase